MRGIVDNSPLNIPPRQIIGSDETLVAPNQGDTDGLQYVYDENDQLIKKWENCMIELTQNMQVAEASTNIWGKTSKGCRDVVPYLMNNRGYVRIIIPTYRGKEFDMKVPCINN